MSNTTQKKTAKKPSPTNNTPPKRKSNLQKVFSEAEVPAMYKDPEWRRQRKNTVLELYMYKAEEVYQMFIYPHEVAKIANINLRAAQRRLQKFRKQFGLPSRQAVSMKDYCEQFRLDLEETKKNLAAYYK